MISPGNITDQTIPPGNTEETQNKMLREQMFLYGVMEFIAETIADDPDKFFSLIEERRQNNGN